LNRAVVVIAEAKSKGRGGGGRELGEHDGKPVSVRKGRFGPYVKCGKVNATLPRDAVMDEYTLEEAVALILVKIVKMEAKKDAPAKKKPAKKKAPAKKKPTKKLASKSTAKAKAKPAKAKIVASETS
jgi:DNA topoisomerase-1